MNLKDSYSKEEINDYINLVNSCPKKMKIESLNKMLKEETDPLKQANILSDIMKLKGVGNDWRNKNIWYKKKRINWRR